MRHLQDRQYEHHHENTLHPSSQPNEKAIALRSVFHSTMYETVIRKYLVSNKSSKLF
jgi:hypothetical protein